MEYEKIINVLDNIANQSPKYVNRMRYQPTKFGTKNWIKINDDLRGFYNKNSLIKFRIATIKTSLCDYSDTYVLVKRTITIIGAGADAA